MSFTNNNYNHCYYCNKNILEVLQPSEDTQTVKCPYCYQYVCYDTKRSLEFNVRDYVPENDGNIPALQKFARSIRKTCIQQPQLQQFVESDMELIRKLANSEEPQKLEQTQKERIVADYNELNLRKAI